MREISVLAIRDAVAAMVVRANTDLNPDIEQALRAGLAAETGETGCSVLNALLENADIAKREHMAICQDTGMAMVFVEVGQDVHLADGDVTEAINEGIRRGYRDGFLRKSVVADPLLRGNTGDNTPGVIHFSIVPGDQVRIDVAPKGFGSENMSALAMLKPSDGIEGVRRFVVEAVSRAGANPCPPIVVGVGIGGSMEKACLLAKRALLRPIGSRSPLAHMRELETELLAGINRLGIGPAGLGGRTTALDVFIESYPTHIAGLPVAVNISCHVTRHASIVLPAGDAEVAADGAS